MRADRSAGQVLSGICAAFAALCVLSTACSRTTRISYNAPIEDVRLAAHEACAAEGFDFLGSGGSSSFSGERLAIEGFFFRQVRERISVDLTQAGGATNAKIVSRKWPFCFLVQTRRDRRVAGLISDYLARNASHGISMAREKKAGKPR